MEQQMGAGLIGVHSYPEATGIFTVLPSKIVGLEEGFYPVTFTKDLYTNFNPQLLINKYGHITYEQLEKLVGSPCKGMSIPGLMTSPIWGYKKLKGLFYE